MRVKQLGNGGGLSPTDTNSSFLIECNKDDYLLFDCGHNVMERLLKSDTKDLVKDINNVFISHIHDDHIGNLGVLIYYRYFVLGKATNIIYANDQVRDYINLMNYDEILVGGKTVTKELIYMSYCPRSYFGSTIKDHGIFDTKGFHGSMKSNGILIENDTEVLFISGDTKASEHIEESVVSKIKGRKFLGFHDYSYWNAPSRNVHACEGDFEIEYSKEFQNQCIKYHTGDKFNKEWRDIV